ncbi:hypothetical protein [Devosia sp. SD17-2]|uniref:hypothetical protein n=1 Tax=Devosia sp. SD17-2 TaxID=2976459 RepID=UPI0023D8C2A7|nr:hypothetical protein [Devosia sp. SD17-2]WEJ34412.1 hypothetical protein NYQ88_06290 [Devosia sp. SD17-2]
MPKNPHQRPQPIQHNRNVPRHGVPPKAPARPLPAAKAVKPDGLPPAVPSLHSLLRRSEGHQ